MAELVYTRVSTDEQSTQRQTHLLTEAGLVNGATACGCSRPGHLLEDPPRWNGPASASWPATRGPATG